MSSTNHIKKSHIARIIEAFASHDYSPAVERKIQTWLADDSYRDEKDAAMDGLWKKAAASHSSFRRQAPGAWERFALSNNLPFPTGMTSIRVLRLWQIAAMFMTVVTVGMIFYASHPRTAPDIVQQHTAVATMNTVLLPDGTEVILNSGSTLLYPEKFSYSERAVYLIGQGSFKVAHDKKHPFIVKSDNFQVTALGTEFDINAYPDEEEVTATLIEGSVKVEYANLSEKAILHPGQQLVFNKRTAKASLRHTDVDDVIAWQHGEMVLTGMTVPDILRTIERRYDYRFSYSPTAFSDDRYTFRFLQNAPLPEVMDIISDVSGGHVRYSITGKDCQVTYR